MSDFSKPKRILQIEKGEFDEAILKNFHDDQAVNRMSNVMFNPYLKGSYPDFPAGNVGSGERMRRLVRMKLETVQ